MSSEDFIDYDVRYPDEKQILANVEEWKTFMETRRSIRFFSDKEVSKNSIEHILMTASSAPSGAHKQPWTFCAISNQELKAKIREAAEKEEYINYHEGRMSEEWIEALKKFETNHIKEFITDAPWIIVVFKKIYDLEDGQKSKNYYVTESVGIACGFLITAIHQAGLVTLTHTPSPMNFLQEILQRPENEKPYLLLPIGYPKKGIKVPNLKRKKAEEVVKYFE